MERACWQGSPEGYIMDALQEVPCWVLMVHVGVCLALLKLVNDHHANCRSGRWCSWFGCLQ